jgi:pilus assembly protein CpaB
VLLVIAVLAAGLAAYLATRGGGTPRTVQEVVQVEAPKTKVLVAAEQIGVGQRLTPKLLQWQDWPESAVREEYVTVSAIPDAPEKLTGTIARFEIFPGEPIMQSKLVHSDQGYLSAVLAKGMRAVSFPVAAESSAGGFVIPNDRVDVVQTLSGETGLQTNTIIENVKVLAIGSRLGERGETAGDKDQQNPRSQVFQAGTIATVEVTPDQAEVMVTAIRKGGLSLVLRSIKDFEGPAQLINASSDSQSVKLVRFGKQSSVVPPSAGVIEPPPIGAADYTGSPDAGMATPQ